MINSRLIMFQFIKISILTVIFIFFFNVNQAYSEIFDLQGEVNDLTGVNSEIVNIIKEETAKIKQEVNENIKQQILQEDSKIVGKINEECNKEFALKTLAIQHFNTVKHLFDETQASLDKYIRYLGILVAVAVVIIGAIVGADIQDTRQVRNSIKDKAEALKKESEETEKLRKELEGELNRLKLLESEIKEKDEEINELLEVRKSLKSKKIIWAFDEKSESDDEMIEDLKNNGFSNISVYDVSELEISSLKQCDCMIYSISQSSSLNNMEAIISSIESIPRKPPLLIYTYSSGTRVSVSDEQMDKLNQYRNYSISTTPGNFKSLFNGLIVGLIV